MSLTQLTVREGSLAGDTIRPLDQPAIISPRRDSIHQKLPDSLLTIAQKEAWHCASLDDIIQHKLDQTVAHVYIDEVLLKAHDPNQVFETIRTKLIDNTYFAFRIVTAENIKASIQQRISYGFFTIYYPFHFLSRRVLPKLKGFRKVCRLLAIPVDISKAEIIGRLIYKGFDIVDLVETAQDTLIIAKANTGVMPSQLRPASKEGFLFRMQRVGKLGIPITVYKFRSMHPYAEYVQEYLHRTNGLDAGGKFKNDFRVSTGGRVLRKYWLDELPMLYNLLKGDIKLIGVRPISEHYFSLYPAQVQQIRKKHKPGLLPPFYADMPTTFDEIVQSELAYLEAYEKAPWQTDLAYLLKILKNIVVHKARSK
ncbi:sugar transferase [Spirosoma aerolatum]|uniref:sugar transferase n=1 Tax=Spirosoma aerolatum TaxID=1211326 RepID=UPI0009AE1C9C|nr:sugar transferase [Spirosoma aerolatum]